MNAVLADVHQDGIGVQIHPRLQCNDGLMNHDLGSKLPHAELRSQLYEKFSGWLLRTIEFAPLAIFLLCLTWLQPYQSGSWASTYYLSSLAAIATTVGLSAQKQVLNRLAIGINLYLLSGSLGQVLQWTWLNQFYGEVLAAGMLGWMVVVGLVSTGFSPKGFIGVVCVDKRTVLRLSTFLLLGAIAALAMSLYFVGNRLLSELLPFVLLFALQSRLRVAAASA